MDSLDSKQKYTLPGVMYFLQQEWKRFEKDRNAWAVEKALLQVLMQTTTTTTTTK